MSDIQSESQHERKGSERGGIGRRRLLRAGLAAAPVVLAVSGRSAMAAACPIGLSQPTLMSVCPNGEWIGSLPSHVNQRSSWEVTRLLETQSRGPNFSAPLSLADFSVCHYPDDDP